MQKELLLSDLRTQKLPAEAADHLIPLPNFSQSGQAQQVQNSKGRHIYLTHKQANPLIKVNKSRSNKRAKRKTPSLNINYKQFGCKSHLQRLALSSVELLVSMSHFPSSSSPSQSLNCPVETSSAWVKTSGSHQFEITSYSQAKKLVGRGDYIESAAFYVGGHAWTIRCCQSNYTPDYSPWVGLFVALASDADIVRALYKLEILDQNGSSVSMASTNLVTFASRGQHHGNFCFVKEESLVLKDDCLTVRCTVTVLQGRRVVESEIPSAVAPPSDLHRHLEQLLDSGEGADVTFQVRGTTFAAHRCVLAARSPVFKAQLLFFDQMKEKNTRCIKIEEMDDAVFKALLHFIYSDSVPAEIDEPRNSSSTTVMAQHLLSAADRYELKRLKSICEEKLCQNMDVETVATTLALAEQHFCDRLKAACLEFIASPEKLIAVAVTDGFDHLKKSCPSVLKELMEKFGFLSVKEA